MKSRLGFPLLVLTGALLIVCACTKPPGERRHFRSDQFYLEATLPPGWAAAEEYGPEHGRHDLDTLWDKTDCREGDTHAGATVVPFFNWGRRLRLEAYCAPKMSDATAQEVNTLLGSWRFDEVPAGDVGWASLEARKQLPSSVQPERFPLLAGGAGESTSQREDLVWTTSGGYLDSVATLWGHSRPTWIDGRTALC